jgi:hypothetical protein
MLRLGCQLETTSSNGAQIATIKAETSLDHASIANKPLVIYELATISEGLRG